MDANRRAVVGLGLPTSRRTIHVRSVRFGDVCFGWSTTQSLPCTWSTPFAQCTPTCLMPFRLLPPPPPTVLSSSSPSSSMSVDRPPLSSVSAIEMSSSSSSGGKLLPLLLLLLLAWRLLTLGSCRAFATETASATECPRESEAADRTRGQHALQGMGGAFVRATSMSGG